MIIIIAMVPEEWLEMGVFGVWVLCDFVFKPGSEGEMSGSLVYRIISYWKEGGVD